MRGNFVLTQLELECHFGENSSAALWESDGSLTCVVPPSTAARQVDFYLSNNGKRFTFNFPFVYFEYIGFVASNLLTLECSPAGVYTGCETCIQQESVHPGCGWCLVSPGCYPVGSCPSFGLWSLNICPLLGSISPVVGNVGESTLVTVNGDHFIQHETLSCSFGSTMVPATFINESYITCTAPPRNLYDCN